MCFKALFKTLDLASSVSSSWVPSIQSLTDCGLAGRPLATVALASTGLCKPAACSHIFSLWGQTSQPLCSSCLASASLPATACSLAAIIYPAWVGLAAMIQLCSRLFQSSTVIETFSCLSCHVLSMLLSLSCETPCASSSPCTETTSFCNPPYLQIAD